ncbi:MAG: hypothetical protein ACI8UO_001162 [Verrucomicrobiales bacterium]|jgi:hypothetical protein
MKSSFAATLLVCGTILLLSPFAYYLVFYSQQSYVLAHRADTTPNQDWQRYGPTFNRETRAGYIQAGVGGLGLAMMITGILGGFGVFERRKRKDEQDARVPLDIILRAHNNSTSATPTTSQQMAESAGPTPAGTPERSRIGVRRLPAEPKQPGDPLA